MMVTLSGDRFHFIPGQEVEFEEEEAQRLVENHYAKFTEDSKNSDNDELTILKAKADTLGIKYGKKIPLEKLLELVNTKEKVIIFDELKLKADSLNIEYAESITLEELTALVQAKEESIALDALKAKADELEIQYDEDVTVEALTKLIEDAENKE